MATDILADPSLRAGDKMSRAEFIKIWDQLPHITRAELIRGVVRMPSPVSTEHGDRDNDVSGWIFYYKAATPGCAAGNNATSFLLDDAPQPDINLRLLPECGGKSWVEHRFLHGMPELFAEISLSSQIHDLREKLALYEEAGVQEYLIILVDAREVRWHQLFNGKYQRIDADADGIWRSHFFPGLWLDGKALLAGDSAKVLAILQEGIASDEHQRFVQELAARKQKSA